MNTSEERGARRDADVPDLILEQYRLRELPRTEADRVERLLSEDPALRERLDAIERSDEEIASRYPAGWVVQRIRDRAPARDSPRVSWRVPVAMAAGLLVMVWSISRPWNDRVRGTVTGPAAGAPQAEGDTERLKGLQPLLAVYRRTAAGSETLADGSVARAGDLLRLGYAGAGRSYGVILSIDGRGLVTLHLPPAGVHAAPLARGGATLLDQAYELDDAPGWERFYFVTGETPFDVAPLVAAARKAAAGAPGRPPAILPIARGLSQSTFSIQKEVKP